MTPEEENKLLRAANIAYSQQVNELIGRAGNAEAEIARLRDMLGKNEPVCDCGCTYQSCIHCGKLMPKLNNN